MSQVPFSPSKPFRSSRSPQLLVSVQNPQEAALTCQLGVPWIDLKNPAAGALGSPTPETALACLAAMHDVVRQQQLTPPQTSVALGELHSIEPGVAEVMLQHFPFCKFGLAGMNLPAHADLQDRWLDNLQRVTLRPGQLVPAIYADYQRAQAWPPEAVVDLAGRLTAQYVLIDTFVKDGLGLFDWFNDSQLMELQQRVRSIGANLVIAGSLRSSHWPQLCAVDAAIIGVRGSVCDTSGDRSSGISAQRVSEWLSWTQGTTAG